ncbi:MAG: hypothetical protein AAF531_17300 [Actinomycetota bacterium]
MSNTVIFAAGSTIFALTTLASLWAGYLFFQRHWVSQNSNLTSVEDHIRPLLRRFYPEQRRPSSALVLVRVPTARRHR